MDRPPGMASQFRESRRPMHRISSSARSRGILMRTVLAAIIAGLALFGLMLASTASPSASITKAVADTTRPKADRDADAHRMPAATLAFSGVKEGDVVGEFLP